ncbi:MAG: antitoxin VbhA family protein [Oscillospiraceae bacterium]|nr:antitoxin VbhA family protein [Oscillospiraceae bacterium]
MENAEASVRMEGYEVTPEMREQCERILRGEATLADYLKRLAKAAGRA